MQEVEELAKFYEHHRVQGICYGYGAIWSDWLVSKDEAKLQFAKRLAEYAEKKQERLLKCPNDASYVTWIGRGKSRGDLPVQLFHCTTCFSIFRPEPNGRLKEFPVESKIY